MISRGIFTTIIKNKYILFLCVFAFLLITSQAYAAILYGHNFYDLGGGLYQIDTVAQTATLVRADVERRYSGPDIQMSPDNSTIYMSRALWWDDTLVKSLLLIDPATGLNTGTLSLSGFPSYIDFDDNLAIADVPTALEFVGETLYASFHQSGPEDYDGILGTIDLNTGAITTIGEMTGMNRPTGGLESVAGTMYAVSSTGNKDSRLFTVNLSTGAATLVGNLTLGGVQQESATALAYADGTMYTLLADSQDTKLYSVDLSTGALTMEFDLGVQINSLTSRSDTLPTIPHAAILYGLDNTDLSGGQLYQIDNLAQTVTLMGADAARENSGPAIQMSPDNSTIYMSGALLPDGTIDKSLFLIDPATGLNTGSLSLSGFPAGTDTPTALEFVGETLYASFHESGPEDYDGILGTIDLNTGAITTIGEMTGMNRPTGGLEYVAGTMYAVSSTDNNGSRLFTVNLSTGAATLVGNLTLNGVQQEAAAALAYADGTMYTLLADSQDTNLYSIDLSTGALTMEYDLGVQINSLTSGSGTLPTILDLDKAKVCWHHDDLHVEGKLKLPAGVGMHDLASAGSAVITLADVGITDQNVEFEVKGKNKDKWKYKDKNNLNGNIKEYKLDWKESKFDYRGDDKFHIHTHYIGATETTLCIHTGKISGPFTVTIDETMYAVSSTDNNGSRLFTVNLSTGAATLVANLTLGGVQQVAATALAYADGTMYTLLADSQDTKLYSVDLSTGALTMEFDLGVQINSLTSRSGTLSTIPHAAILYGHDNTDLSGGQLYQIDTVAQTVTLVRADAEREDSGLDIQMSPDNSTIYMSRALWPDDTIGQSLFLIDPATGLNSGTLSLSGFPIGTDTPTALEFVGETLYASFHQSGPEDYDGILGTIDLNTGAITTIGEMTGMNRPTGGLEYAAGTTIAYDEDRSITTSLEYESQKVDNSHVHFTLPFQLTSDMTIEVTGALVETIKVADYFDEAHAKFKLVSAFDPGLFPDGWKSSPETLNLTLTLGEGTNMAAGYGLIDSWEKKDVKHWEADDDNPGDIDNCQNDPNKTEPGECGCCVPEGTCDITDASVITASDDNSPPGEEKEKAFDGDVNTKWLIFQDSGWIQYEFGGGTAKVIKAYSITSANDFPERDPRDWKLMGSDNGTDWITLDERSNDCFPNRFHKKEYRVNNNNAYKIYRLDITSNRYPASANSIQLSEIELLESSNGGIEPGEDGDCNQVNETEFTIAVIPDTQKLSESNQGKNLMIAMNQFLVDRKAELNVKFVISLGDMTQDGNDDDEWARVKEAYDVFPPAGIPFAPCRGHHDNINSINKWFPVSDFENMPTWGGSMNGGIENAYYLFSAGGMDFVLVLNEEPYDGTAKNWANDIFRQHSDRRGIFAAHNIQPGGGEQDNLITQHDNIFMAVAGHDCRSNGEDHWTSTSPSGYTQNLMLTDYQGRSNEGAFVRYYTFKPNEDQVCARTYNITDQAYEEDGDSQFCFYYDMQPGNEPPTVDGDDSDGDGVEDSVDNCPNNANANQADADGDGLGDACDPITDSDDDGIEDAADNCPNNANANQADADGDDLGDACDPMTDSDGDGMPDNWETQNGLDPDSADAAADPDADGISNLDEYLGGTDPAVYDGNDEPDAPVLYSPAAHETVSLTPELQTEEFYDPDSGDTHSQSQWQIIRQADDRVVLDIKSAYELTSLSVPKLVLEEDTSYSWRARFHDNHGFASQWSQTSEFTTELQTEDTDGNGILDAQEVDALMDLDGDGTADLDQEDIKCVNVQGANGQVGISIQDSAAVVAIEALESMDPSDPQFEGQGSGMPEHMPFGLINFKILVNEAGAEAVVKVHLSEPVPADSKWYKFDPIADTWLDYSEYAVLSSDGKSVALTIIDGGFGDLDGTANGIIIDPSGIATSSAGDSSGDEILDSAGEILNSGGSCFITTAAHRPAGLQPLNFSADGRRPQWAILILLLGSLIICLKKRGWTG